MPISTMGVSGAIDYLTKPNEDWLTLPHHHHHPTLPHPPTPQFNPVHITDAANHTCAMLGKKKLGAGRSRDPCARQEPFRSLGQSLQATGTSQDEQYLCCRPETQKPGKYPTGISSTVELMSFCELLDI